MEYIIDENGQTVALARSEKAKDVGVWFDGKLNFREHMHEKINKAFIMLGLMKRATTIGLPELKKKSTLLRPLESM